MTPDLLESDIELAKAMMVAGHPDHEILEALRRRRLDPSRAAQLVNDLRYGRPIIQAMSLVPRGRTQRSEDLARDNESEPAPTGRRTGDGDHRERSRSSAGPLLLGIFLGVTATLLAVWAYPYVRPASAESELAVAARTIPGAAAAEIETRGARGSYEFQISPTGLQVCGNRVGRQNALAALSNCLGNPTRTNHVSEANQTVYAYDGHGVLYYEAVDGGETSLVIDFQARGGDHSAKSPFAGNFRIGGALIESTTDAKALRAIPSLELSEAASGGGLLGARYKKLEMFFAYRATPDRLSLVQINLK